MSRDNPPRHTDETDPYPADPPTAAAGPPPASVPVPVPDDFTEGEVKAFEEMNKPLQVVTLGMRDLMLNEMTSLLGSRYALGSLVLEVKKNPKIYGAMGDIQLATFFGESGKTVYNEARRIRERYSPEEYAKIKEAVSPKNGARISYKHLAVLLRIEDNKLAHKMLDACLHAGWDTKELVAHVGKKLAELGQPTGASRRQPRAATFLGLVENWSSVTDGWTEHYTDTWNKGRALVEAFDKIPEEKLDEALLNRLKKARAQAEKFEETQSYMVQEFRRFIDRVGQAVKERRQGGAAQAHTPEDDDDSGGDVGDVGDEDGE
jgi:hypothetical protein